MVALAHRFVNYRAKVTVSNCPEKQLSLMKNRLTVNITYLTKNSVKNKHKQSSRIKTTSKAN